MKWINSFKNINLPKLTQGEIFKKWNSSISLKYAKFIIKTHKEISRPRWLQLVNSVTLLRENEYQLHTNSFQKIKKEETLLNLFYESNVIMVLKPE